METSKIAAIASPLPVFLELGLENAGMILHLIDGQVQACNRTAEQILGSTIEQLQRRGCFDEAWNYVQTDGSRLKPEHHPSAVALATRQRISGFIMGLHRFDGGLLWLQMDVQPLFQNSSEEPWAAVILFKDVTAQATFLSSSSSPRIELSTPSSSTQIQRTVLVVEDCAEDREVFRRHLSRDSDYRYRILEAETGEEALEICKHVKLDAILLDYYLPDYDGLELLRDLDRQVSHWIPILLMTGQGNESLAVQAIKSGAEDYLVKGDVTGDDLRSAVTNAIEKTALQLQLRRSLDRERLVAQIAQQIRQSLDLETILSTTVEEVRRLFETDRVLIFHFNDDGSGTVISESVGAEWDSILSQTLVDPCFASAAIQHYQQGEVSETADVQTASLSACYVEMLTGFQVKANLVAPILEANQIWGLLIAHHCAAPRAWQPTEMDLLKQLSTQVGNAIQQAELYQKSQLELAERRRSELFVHKILDGSYDCIKVLDLDARLLYMNPGGQEQMGICDFSTMEHCQWNEFWNGEDRIAAQQALNTARAGGSCQFEGFCPSLDGTPKWWEVRVSPILDEQGNVERILSVSRDVTNRKEAEHQQRDASNRLHLLSTTAQELLRSEQPLMLIETLFQSLKEALDIDVCLNHLLDQSLGPDRLWLASHFGIDSSLANRLAWLEIGQGSCGTADQQGDYVQTSLQHAIEFVIEPLQALGLTAYVIQPLVVQAKLLGTLAFGSHRRSRFTPEEKELLQALCDQIAVALEKANLIDSLQKQTQKLREASRLKDDFLAVLSHELRSPLTPILGWLDLLKRDKLEADKRARAIEIIEQSAKRQSQLIEDLLDISSIMHGKLTLDATAIHLDVLVSDAIESVSLAAKTKQIKIKAAVEPGLAQILGDAGRLQQVLWNLLTNAVKFTDKAGSIDIQLMEVDRAIQFQIADTGKGIDPSFAPFVFDYFQQQDSSTTRCFGGLGLGLAISRHIVELHGGKIWVDSAGEGLGTTFTFEIPAIQSPESLNKSTFLESVPLAPLSGICILIVDDDENIRDLLSSLLEISGAITTVADSANKALRLVEALQPDVLLCDICMPGIDGYALIRTIRTTEQGKNLPAIAVTAYVGESIRFQALSEGFQHCISKPVDFQVLVAVIQDLTSDLTESSGD